MTGAAVRSNAPGPRPRNAEQTRAHLLEVATAEFADKGFAGARIDEIVKRCGVSKNLVYHYFKSKEALFVEVLERAYARMRARQNEWRFAELEPEEAIARLTVHTFRHFLDDPAVIPLMNAENLHKATHIALSRKIPKLYNPLIAAIKDILARGQAAGRFRRDVDPFDLYITISGISYFYLSNHHTLSYVLGQDLMTPRRLKKRERHMVEVVTGYLRA